MGGKIASSASGVGGGSDPWSFSERKPIAGEGPSEWMPSWPLDELECRVGAIVVSHSFPCRSRGATTGSLWTYRPSWAFDPDFSLPSVVTPRDEIHLIARHRCNQGAFRRLALL